jgi:hypothetical protein
VPCLIKIGPEWFWRRRFSKDLTLFSYFCDYLPFEKDLALNYLKEKLEFPSPKDILYQVCLFWPAGSREDF